MGGEKISLSAEKCRRCGRCLGVCPSGLFTFPERTQAALEEGQEMREVPVVADDAFDRCIDCGHCVASCPAGAITVGEWTPEKLVPVNASNLPSFESFGELVKTRRSIRKFKKEPVCRSDLARLFELVRWAPTAKNRLPIRWGIVNDPAETRRLAGIIIDGFRTKPEFQKMAESWDAGNDPVLRGAPCLLFTVTDAETKWNPFDSSIAAEIIDLAIPLLGLGGCWAGFFIMAAESNPILREALGLTKNDRVGAALMVGRPDGEFYLKAPYRPASRVFDVRNKNWTATNWEE